MKNTLMIAATLLLFGCHCHTDQCSEMDVELAPDNSKQTLPAAIPCSYSYVPTNHCIAYTEPMVLKPRVTETVKKVKQRPCCNDNEPVLPFEAPETYVPDAPEIYVISANRTINAMQNEAEAFYKQVGNIRVFIDKAEPKSEDLPGGMDKGTETLKKRFAQMNNVTVVENKMAASYIVSSVADWYDTATKKVPAIKYDLLLKGRDGHLIGEWSEIIHQAEGDRSWW